MDIKSEGAVIPTSHRLKPLVVARWPSQYGWDVYANGCKIAVVEELGEGNFRAQMDGKYWANGTPGYTHKYFPTPSIAVGWIRDRWVEFIMSFHVAFVPLKTHTVMGMAGSSIKLMDYLQYTFPVSFGARGITPPDPPAVDHNDNGR